MYICVISNIIYKYPAMIRLGRAPGQSSQRTSATVAGYSEPRMAKQPLKPTWKIIENPTKWRLMAGNIIEHLWKIMDMLLWKIIEHLLSNRKIMEMLLTIIYRENHGKSTINAGFQRKSSENPTQRY